MHFHAISDSSLCKAGNRAVSGPATFADMLWVYILAGTAGVVFLVPTVLRAIDGLPADVVGGTIGFSGTMFGLAGIVFQQFDMGTSSVLVAAAALGGALGAIHPEILKALRGKPSNLPG